MPFFVTSSDSKPFRCRSHAHSLSNGRRSMKLRRSISTPVICLISVRVCSKVSRDFSRSTGALDAGDPQQSGYANAVVRISQPALGLA
jgi:hypothetical protein